MSAYVSKAARRAARIRRGPTGPLASSTPIPEAIRRFDPLDHGRGGSLPQMIALALLALAAVVLHGMVLGAFLGFGEVWAALRTPDPKDENIEVALVEPPPPPPPPPVEPPPPEPEKAPEKKPEPVKPKKELPPPPPDPIDKPPPPKEQPPPDPAKPPPRRVVGLSLESTVEGAGGPSFATGNTRMGTTDTKAASPTEVAPIPKDTPPEPPVQGPTNRAATRVPTAGVKLVEPERKKKITPKYPEKLRLDGVEADVVVRVTLDAKGKAVGVAVVSSTIHPDFDRAAKEAALLEEFTPALKDGTPIPYSLTFTYRFRLND